MGSPVHFLPDAVKALKSKLKFFNNKELDFSGDTDDPNLVAKDMAIGSVYQQGNTDDLFIKRNGGSTTEFSKFNKGLAFSGKNLYPRGDFESSVAADFVATGLTLSFTTTASEVNSGTRALKIVAGATSQTLETINIPIDKASRKAGFLGMRFAYDCGADWTLTVTDETNSNVLMEETLEDPNAYAYKEFVFYVAPDTANISVTLTSTTSDSLVMSDLLITSDTRHFSVVPIEHSYFFDLTQSISNNTVSLGSGASPTKVIGSGIFSFPTPETVEVLVDCHATISFGIRTSAAAVGSATINRTSPSAIELGYDSTTASNNANAAATYSGPLSAGDIFRFDVGGSADEQKVSFKGTAQSEAIITNTTNFAPVKYSSNAGNTITDNTNTFIDFEDQDFDDDNVVLGAGSGNVTTSGTGWRWVSSRSGYVSVDAMVSLNPGGALDINETFRIDIYLNGSRVTRSQEAMHGSPASPILNRQVSDIIKVNKGDIIEIVSLHNSGSSIPQYTTSGANFCAITYVDREYTVNAALPAVCIINPRSTDSFQDNVAATTSYKTIDLDNVEGDTFFCSVDSNQMTIAPGKYVIDVPIGALGGTGFITAKLYDATNTSDIKVLENGPRSGSGDNDISWVTMSFLLTSVDSAAYEIQTLSGTATGTEYWGLVKITKLR